MVYNATSTQLNGQLMRNEWDGLSTLFLQRVEIMGIRACPRTATLNGKTISSFTCDQQKRLLEFDELGISMASEFELDWDSQ